MGNPYLLPASLRLRRNPSAGARRHHNWGPDICCCRHLLSSPLQKDRHNAISCAWAAPDLRDSRVGRVDDIPVHHGDLLHGGSKHWVLSARDCRSEEESEGIHLEIRASPHFQSPLEDQGVAKALSPQQWFLNQWISASSASSL